MSLTPHILLVPSRDIDTQSPLLGLSLTERAALMLARYYRTDRVHAPQLSADRQCRGVTITREAPPLDRPIVLADPLLLFDGRLLHNLTVNFEPPTVACDPDTLEPIGFARLLPEHLPDDFLDDPWLQVRAFLTERQDARVAVVAARYFSIRRAADIAGAEQFLLRSILHKGDDLIERHLTRPLSRHVTAWTANLQVSPDLWSLLVILFGIAGSFLLFLPGATGTPLTFLPLALAAILSSVDGETARLTFRTSPRGGILNYYSGRVVVWVFFLCLTILSRETPFMLVAGLGFSLCYPLLIVHYDRYRHPSDRPRSWVQLLERAIRRNFSIHTVTLGAIVLALFGILDAMLPIILPLCALGAVLVLFEAVTRRRERRRRP